MRVVRGKWDRGWVSSVALSYFPRTRSKFLSMPANLTLNAKWARGAKTLLFNETDAVFQ